MSYNISLDIAKIISYPYPNLILLVDYKSEISNRHGKCVVNKQMIDCYPISDTHWRDNKIYETVETEAPEAA